MTGARAAESGTLLSVELHIFVGADAWLARTRSEAILAETRVGPGEIERIDCATDAGAALVDAVAAPSLFGPRRVVRVLNLHECSPENARAVERYAPGSDAVVVARAEAALPAELRTALSVVGKITTCTPPSGKGVAIRIEELATHHGLRLDGRSRQLLVQRGGDDLARVESICAQLSQAGMTTPTPAQLQVLLGTTQADATPWALSDALEGGSLSDALEVASRLEPLAALGYLASRLVSLGRVVDAQPRSADEILTLLELKHRFQAERLLGLSRRVGAAEVARAWDVVLRADRRCKRGFDQRAALEIACGQLYQIWRSPLRR